MWAYLIIFIVVFTIFCIDKLRTETKPAIKEEYEKIPVIDHKAH